MPLTLNSYQNQREVGEGLKRAFQDVPGLKREDLFIVSSYFRLTSFADNWQTSKLWNTYALLHCR